MCVRVCKNRGCGKSRCRGDDTLCRTCLSGPTDPKIEAEELRAVRDYRSVLVNLDLADVSGVLAAAKQTQDLLCLSLLALVWDPDVAMRLSILFEGFAGRQYDASDVRSALQTVLAEYDADDGGRPAHFTEIMNIGGASRFFGLKQLCERLQVTRGDPLSPSKPRRGVGRWKSCLPGARSCKGKWQRP